jgi:hypothetical protein
MLLSDVDKFIFEVLLLGLLKSLLLLLSIDVVIEMGQTEMKLLVGV